MIFQFSISGNVLFIYFYFFLRGAAAFHAQTLWVKKAKVTHAIIAAGIYLL